jgi:hypothetical protein
VGVLQTDGPSDRQTDGQADRQTDGRTDRRAERPTDRWTGTDGPTDRRTERPTDGQADRQTDGQTDRRTDGQADHAVGEASFRALAWLATVVGGDRLVTRFSTPPRLGATANRRSRSTTAAVSSAVASRTAR